MRELRHDFRAVYRVSYDEVPTDEAIDLIMTLPERGSLWRAAKGSPDAAWSEIRHVGADIVDAITARMWQAAGAPGEQPPRTQRPSDIVEAAKARAKAAEVKKKMNETKWEEV